MKAADSVMSRRTARWGRLGLVAILGVALPAELLLAVTVEVQEPDGTPVNGFRWLLEEDNTDQPLPGVLDPVPPAVRIHKSHAPVVMSGHSDSNSAVIDVPSDSTRYIVSVLPDASHTLGGGMAVGNQAETVLITVNAHPVPTAQISILVFEDNAPINNAPETPLELGLAGFTVTLSDAAGMVSQDAFGNPLGTTYTYVGGVPKVETMGNGVITTNAAGEVLVKYLVPGKYGIRVVPPPGQGWIQTNTIEGTPTIDAWVKANEPPVFVEFGPAAYHAFFGFIKPFDNLASLPTNGQPTGTITGRIVYNHFSRPPFLQGFFPGPDVPEAWVGLNEIVSRQGVYAQPCPGGGSQFTITGVPAGSYELVTWDRPLDSIFGFHTVTVPDANGSYNIELGDVLTFSWFGTLRGSVFYDADRDGFRDPSERGIPDQAVNLRFRDGTIYQATATDPDGDYSFEEVFPFFKWLITEVDFLRYRDTGYTNVVDYGGQILPDNGWAMPSRGALNPQPQASDNPNTGNNLSRTEADPTASPGAFLLQAMHLFLGQTNVIDWGKVNYGPAESGGISGIVYYAVTRAEDDPRLAVGDPWEAGVPRVQIALYQDYDVDGLIDDLDSNPGQTLADRDNYPLGWADGTGPKGPEDVDWNNNDIFDPGDAIQIVWADSFDDNPPAGCIQDLPVIHGQTAPECFDNFATWNQIRPGVFDGGWAIESHFPGGMASGNPEVPGVPPGVYIVEAAQPAGYETVKEEDKNVDYGDEFGPSTLALPALPPPCVGDAHLVPDFLTLRGADPAEQVPAPYAGEMRPLCDRKQVVHQNGQNTAVNFFVFTEVPKAARAVGFINNDLAAEFDTTSPVYGEKSAPAWLPISFQDYAGNEILRVYCDEFGVYNALLPSTWTANVPAPTGISPHMISFVLNHPGPIPDPNNPGQFIIDPYFDPDYGQAPYTFQFESGRTTYLDTPVIPVAAFAGYPNRQLDAEPVSGTPVIYSVVGSMEGPIVCADGDSITITSMGQTQVPNPDYDPRTNPGAPVTIPRDFGFGAAQGAGQVTVDGVPVTVTSWNDHAIVATVDTGLVSTGQLLVTRDNGRSTPLGVTLHVGGCGATTVVTGGGTWPATPIQDAIDAAAPGTLILVGPGTYRENVIIYKNIQLQGAGAGSTFINASPVPNERVTAWHAKIAALIASGDIGDVHTELFEATEAPGALAIGQPDTFDANNRGLFDGFTVLGGVSGGGIYAMLNADYFEISNNRIMNNQGTFGGGITVGTIEGGSANDFINIHHNRIAKNGGMDGAGGVMIFADADSYQLTDNVIIGNFTRFVGGGVAHMGVSNGATIARNQIVFNEVFYGELLGGHGGGLFIGSDLALPALIPGLPPPPPPGQLGNGAGSVSVLSNLIQGNLAGSGSGGGIYAHAVNGQDVLDNPANPAAWYSLTILNNMIVNNVAAFRGGGVALEDCAATNILHNTIANNDNTATAALAFSPGDLLHSNSGAGGITASSHSPQFAAATGQTFSDPLLVNNIIWHNRSYVWDGTLNNSVGGIVPNTPPYWDLQVVGGGQMNPQYCILSDTTGYPGTNTAADPLFALAYRNGLLTASVLDEGGNAISVRYMELAVSLGDYHLRSGSPAIDAGSGAYAAQFAALAQDIDGQGRPAGTGHDIGADEADGAMPQDGDGDGDVDLADFGAFQACFNGPNRLPAGPNCAAVDFDGDGDVDLADFGAFQACFNGPNRLPACGG